MTLCDFEVDVLRVCAGVNVPGMQWGAAMGAALESLCGARLVQRSAAGVYSASPAGIEWLADYAAASSTGKDVP